MKLAEVEEEIKEGKIVAPFDEILGIRKIRFRITSDSRNYNNNNR